MRIIGDPDRDKKYKTEEVNHIKVLNQYGWDGWELVHSEGDVTKLYLLKKESR